MKLPISVSQFFVVVLHCLSQSTCVDTLTRADFNLTVRLVRQAAGTPGSDEFMKFAGHLVQLWFHNSATFSVARTVALTVV